LSDSEDRSDKTVVITSSDDEDPMDIGESAGESSSKDSDSESDFDWGVRRKKLPLGI